MINGLEGIPGSGKSYEAVAFHVLPALQSGRKVVTNLPLNVDAFAAIDPAYRDLIEVRHQPAARLGDWDPADIAKRPAFQLWADGRSEPAPVSVFTFGAVWDYYTTWQDGQGRGPLFVIDECHVALPKVGTPDAVVQWFKLHRHFNVDVLLITQSFRDINQPIAQLVATLIKCRKADVLGKANHYIRKVHAGYRGAQIQTDQREYKPQFFGLYKSHTQGRSVSETEAQDVSPMIVKFNRVKWAVVLVGICATVWAFWPKSDRDVFGVKKMAARQDQVVRVARPASAPALPASAPASAALPASASAPVAPASAASASALPDGPFAGKGLHIVGEVQAGARRVVAFMVSLNSQRIFTVTSLELEAAGYKFMYMSYCAGWLEYQGNRRAVTCDAPQLAAGRADAPIVITNGARSDMPIGSNARRLEPVELVSNPSSRHVTAADVVSSYRQP